MIKKALDEKYSYQIDEHNIVHLFRGEDDCQQYLTNPLLGAIFKIETLEKENAELKAFKEKCKFNVNDIFKEIETENKLTKAKDLLKRCYDKYGIYDVLLLKELEQFISEVEK